METEQFILKQLINGKTQPEISDLMKIAGMKPNSLSYIEKKLKSIKREHGAKTMFHLGVILTEKGLKQ